MATEGIRAKKNILVVDNHPMMLEFMTIIPWS